MTVLLDCFRYSYTGAGLNQLFILKNIPIARDDDSIFSVC